MSKQILANHTLAKCRPESTLLLQCPLGETGEEAWPVIVHLSNGKQYGADLVISAIGVEADMGWLPAEVKRTIEDGGILVDR